LANKQSPLQKKGPLPLPQNLLQKKQPVAQEPAEAHAGPFTMVLYRSETINHPKWDTRVANGISVWKPWKEATGNIYIPTLFGALINDIKNHFTSTNPNVKKNDFDKLIGQQDFVNKVLDVYARHLTTDSPKTSVAFARDPKASYDLDYDYIVHVKDVYTFSWGPNLSILKPARFSNFLAVDAHYIVLDNQSLERSTILAFGQKNAKFSGFYEVDFFTTAKSVMRCKCVRKGDPDEGKILYDKLPK
jgi:hypothetical protein